MKSAGVDYGCLIHLCYPLARICKMRMNVSMYKIPGIIPVNEPEKTPESSVTQILGIMDKSGRCMGDDNIHAFPPPESQHQFSDFCPHLDFSILTGTSVVPPGAFQSQNAQASELHQFSVYISAPIRFFCRITDVMISPNIVQRCAGFDREKGQIFRRQISAGKNQVSPPEFLCIKIRIKAGDLFAHFAETFASFALKPTFRFLHSDNLNLLNPIFWVSKKCQKIQFNFQSVIKTSEMWVKKNVKNFF